MVLDFKALRPVANYPPYPPYHNGSYIEEYFYNFYLNNRSKFDALNKVLIPIFWTNLYINGIPNNIVQSYVDCLPAGNYFTVCQFDDGIQQTLPPDTINFVAGGNKEGIPIPLICSPIPSKYIHDQPKDIFCSFVGTLNDTEKYACRIKLYEYYSGDKDFYFTEKRAWDRVIANDRLVEFFDITQRSRFTLCPRGYGLQSFRLYEAIQLNSIPVFVYDKEFLPFKSEINWNDFCVLLHINDISNLKTVLNGISEEKQQRMLEKAKQVYKLYFTLEGMCKQILTILKTIQ